MSHPVHVQPVTSWRTSDGRLHAGEVGATMHQEHLDRTVVANKMLDAGCNLVDVLDALNGFAYPACDERDLLARITKHTKFSIPHWQCRDEAGYQLVRFEVGGGMFVHGHVGSWSGAYGANVSLRDLLHYARDTMKRNGGVLPTEAA